MNLFLRPEKVVCGRCLYKEALLRAEREFGFEGKGVKVMMITECPRCKWVDRLWSRWFAW